MMNSPASAPITTVMPIASGVEAFGSMAALVGLVVAAAALACAAGTGILMLFPASSFVPLPRRSIWRRQKSYRPSRAPPTICGAGPGRCCAPR